MNEIIERICPMTIILNVGALGISMTEFEMSLKLVSYSTAIIWTIIKISKELKNWNRPPK
tara:strand:+ start:11872 stop:12051 length:180 start_codon:yes stop_codon:yes gene_type:complete